MVTERERDWGKIAALTGHVRRLDLLGSTYRMVRESHLQNERKYSPDNPNEVRRSLGRIT